MKIEVIHTNSVHASKFKNFVSQKALLFHSQEWINNYPEDKLVQCAILNKNEDVIGCFIYFVFKKFKFQFIITPPFTPDIQLTYINPAESVVGKNSFTKDILALLADYFNQLKSPFISLHLPKGIVDSQPFIWKGFASKLRYTYLVDLSKTTEELWDNLSSEKRKSINKAVKDELQIKQSDNAALVYDLIVQSLDRNDQAKNLGILKKIIFDFANSTNSFAFLAYQNEKPIGATFCLINQTSAVYLFGGFDSANKHHGAGVSCMWQSILKAKQLGLRYFDFEGSMNSSIERYFREFGGDLHSYVCVEKINPLLNLGLTLKKEKLV